MHRLKWSLTAKQSVRLVLILLYPSQTPSNTIKLLIGIIAYLSNTIGFELVSDSPQAFVVHRKNCQPPQTLRLPVAVAVAVVVLVGGCGGGVGAAAAVAAAAAIHLKPDTL